MKTTLTLCVAALSVALSAPSVSATEIASTYRTALVASKPTRGVQRSLTKHQSALSSYLKKAMCIIKEAYVELDGLYLSVLDEGVSGLSQESIDKLKNIEELLVFQVNNVKLVISDMEQSNVDGDALESVKVYFKALSKVKVKSIRLNDLIRQFSPPSKVFNSDMDFAVLKEIAKHTNKALGVMKFH